jgi:penicillin amidase
MQTPEYNAYGVSFPGVPGIIIGFNKNMAWGVTNVGHDVLDWYRIDWANPEKTAYRIDGEEKPVQEVVEVIQVKGRDEPLRDTVRYTVWGPVTYDDPEHPNHDMAMRWLAHDEPAEKPFYALGVFTRLMGGQGLSDYQTALRGWESPAQNFVFASKANDIAITVNGKLPLKEDQQGRFVQDGSRSASGWKGFIPHERLPRVVNPERGFVSSANQRSTALDYPYYYNGGFDDYRGRYINRRLAEMENITVEDMKALQLDSRSLKPEDALPVLLQLLDSTASELRAHERVKTLRSWDYNFTKDAEAPSLFEDWFEAAYAQAFDEFTVWEDSLEVLKPEDWRFIELLATRPGHPIFDHQSTPDVETAMDIVLLGLEAALEKPPVSWADHKSTDIGHMAMIPAFSRSDLDVGGYGDAPNAIKPNHGPSWRMVVELGGEPNAWGIFPGGPSGNPGSAFYDPMVTPWVEGQYNRLHLLDSPDDPAVTPLYRLTFKTAE